MSSRISLRSFCDFNMQVLNTLAAKPSLCPAVCSCWLSLYVVQLSSALLCDCYQSPTNVTPRIMSWSSSCAPTAKATGIVGEQAASLADILGMDPVALDPMESLNQFTDILMLPDLECMSLKMQSFCLSMFESHVQDSDRFRYLR